MCGQHHNGTSAADILIYDIHTTGQSADLVHLIDVRLCRDDSLYCGTYSIQCICLPQASWVLIDDHKQS